MSAIKRMLEDKAEELAYKYDVQYEDVMELYNINESEEIWEKRVETFSLLVKSFARNLAGASFI